MNQQELCYLSPKEVMKHRNEELRKQITLNIYNTLESFDFRIHELQKQQIISEQTECDLYNAFCNDLNQMVLESDIQLVFNKHMKLVDELINQKG